MACYWEEGNEILSQEFLDGLRYLSRPGST